MKIFSIYGLDEKLKIKLKNEADKKQWSLSKLIIQIIQDYIKK